MPPVDVAAATVPWRSSAVAPTVPGSVPDRAPPGVRLGVLPGVAARRSASRRRWRSVISNAGSHSGSPAARAKAWAPWATSRTCRPSSRTRRASVTGLATRLTAPTAPQPRRSPSMIEASISTVPASVRTAPRPALERSSSSRLRTAPSTASSARPPPASTAHPAPTAPRMPGRNSPAPAPKGGNRRGRMFTGDRSGDWLFEALHHAGFANQPTSMRADDGLRLRDAYITATIRCAPPANKPLPAEILACRPYLLEELRLLDRVRVVVGLGRIGWDAYLRARRALGKAPPPARPGFAHGVASDLGDGVTLIACYHPSQQNTFTGKLTRPMLSGGFTAARRVIADDL